MGAEAVQTMLRELDLDKLSAELKAEIETLTSKERNRDTEGQKRAHAVKRLEVVESFRSQRQQARMDGADRPAGYPAGSAPDGAAGRRPFRRV